MKQAGGDWQCGERAGCGEQCAALGVKVCGEDVVEECDALWI